MVKEIIVEFGGRKKKVSASELQTLAQKKYITPNSLIWVDGRQTLFGDAKTLLGLDDGDSSSSNEGNSALNDSRVNFSSNVSIDASTVKSTGDMEAKLSVPVPDVGSNALASSVPKKPSKILYASILAIIVALILGVVFIRSDKKDAKPQNGSSVVNSKEPKETDQETENSDSKKGTTSVDDNDGNNADDSEEPKETDQETENSNSKEETPDVDNKNENNFDDSEKQKKTSQEAEAANLIEEDAAASRNRNRNEKNTYGSEDETNSFEKDELEEKTARRPNTLEEPSTYNYQNEPFTPFGAKIPAEFTGVDVGKLYENIVEYLDSLNLEKEPYESVKQYEKRLKLLRSELFDYELLGKITFSSKIALVFHTEASAKFDRSRARVISSYDATRKLFVVKLVEPVKSYSYREDDEFCNVCAVVEKSDGYQAYDLKEASWGIQDVPKDQASKLSDSCAVLCVCSLQSGLDVENIPYGDATEILYTSKIGTLYRLYDESSRTLFVTKPEYWLYNERTGEIIATFTEQETVRNKRKYWGKDNLVRPSNVDKSNGAVSASQSSRSSSDDVDFESLLAWDDDSASQSSSSSSGDPQEVPSPQFRTITIPDDAETLAEACQLARKNDHILLKKSSQPYSLGTDATWLRLTQKLTIAGETGDPSDVVIRLDNGQSLSIQADDVSFEGITFLRAESSHDVCASTEYSNVQFRRCDFKCAPGAEDAIGVSAKGIAATCVLEDCRFINFGIYALDVDDDANVELKDGVFEKNQIAVQLRRKGSCDVQKTLFLSNTTALRIENECEAIVKNCRFKGGERVWDREAGSIVKATENEGDEQ